MSAQIESDLQPETVAVFMDLPNIDGARLREGGGDPSIRFNFVELLGHIKRPRMNGGAERDIVLNKGFTRFNADQGTNVRHWLGRFGIDVDLVEPKPSQQRMVRDDDSGRSSNGPDENRVDMAMQNAVWLYVVNCLRAGVKIGTIVLITGDGDFTPLVRDLRTLRIRVEVYGPRGGTAESLRSSANLFVHLSKDDPTNEDWTFMYFERGARSRMRDRQTTDEEVDDALIDLEGRFPVAGASSRG